MNIVRPTSLAATLDSAAEALFYQKPIPTSLREDIATLLVSRQVQSGSNSGFYLPFAAESGTKSRLFSGEQVNTEFARRHIQLIEATRLLNLLANDISAVAKSVQIADQRMNAMCYHAFCSKGECKSITIAYIRYLVSSGQNDSAKRINSFLTQLVGHRDGKGKWNGFPYFYTLLMLCEVDDPLAAHELRYAIATSPKQSRSMFSADTVSMRRQAILARAFSRS
jgi:hypothetical protein